MRPFLGFFWTIGKAVRRKPTLSAVLCFALSRKRCDEMPPHSRSRRTAQLAAILTITLAITDAAIAASSPTDISQCRAIEDPAARLRCYERLAPAEPGTPGSPPLSSPPASQYVGKWRLVRTPNPEGSKDAIAITRPAELSGSDPDFAGLMIRCADIDIEVLLVLIHPLPLRAHPRVSINGSKFESSVAPPGLAVLLPREVALAARQGWQSLQTLNFEIEERGTVTKGLVVLDDLDKALAALLSSCALRR
jgi:hypothetical protein